MMLKEDGAEPLVLPNLGIKPLIGVIHLPPIASYRRRGADIESLIEYSIAEAKKLEEAGFDAVIVENYGDKPYYMDPSDDQALVAALAVIAREIVRSTNLTVGVNVLRNGAKAAIAAAYASGAKFVRINSYCEIRLSPEGLLTPKGAEVEEARRVLPASIQVYADIDVKHSYGLEPLEHVVKECRVRSLVDGFIASGSRTSEAPDPGYVASIKAMLQEKPLLIGSGINVDNIKLYWSIADGFIVGTSIKIAGTETPIDVQKAHKLASIARELRRKENINNIPLGRHR